MRYKITQHTQRDGFVFYTIQAYSGGFFPRGYLYNLDEHQYTYDFAKARRFQNEAQANSWVDYKEQQQRIDRQAAHDAEIIRSKVVQDREIR